MDSAPQLRRMFWVATVFALPLISGCAEWPSETGSDAPALLISTQSILELDGLSPESPYRAVITAGPHTVLVKYRTYTSAFHCTFEFEAAPGERYEIIQRSNPVPLSLYRGERSNWLWTTRHDPVLPVQCVTLTR